MISVLRNILDVLVPLFGIIYICLNAYNKTKFELVSYVAELIAVAEKTGLTGSEKMARVVTEMYKKVPNSLKKVLNEKQLEMIAQWIFNWMRRYADAYLDTKQNADKTDTEETLNKKTDTAVAKVTADLIMELMDLTEDALRQKAADYGIDLEGKNTKDEIVREIIRHILNVA